MEKFEVHILGCGSALPTMRHNPASQVVCLNDKMYMIDCGEGTQLQYRKAHLSFTKLNRIFISHLHGDHCFGLIGLVSTLSLLGRTAPLYVHAPAELERLMRPQLDFFCQKISFEVVFYPFSFAGGERIFEDKSVVVSTIPLRHRLPCCGFLFCEKAKLPHIRRDMLDFLKIPVCEINNIKLGADWTTADGEVIPNERLVRPAIPPRSYAYCSDTAYMPRNAELLQGVTVLYHEATFAENEKNRAAETYHSTARQAALVAQNANVGKLVIGHFSSRYDDEQMLLEEARAVFPATCLAKEGLRLDISSV